MIANYNRTKLINVILFFAKNTNFCGVTKLFKLLYFLDFGHYQDTGRSVTGLEYFAWKMGPVPVTLYEEIECPDPDIAEKVTFEPVKTKFEKPMMLASAKAEFDPSHFSKREIRLLKMLAKQYKNSKSDEMIEATHLENLPWNQVYNIENKRQEKIPYEYALRKAEKDIIKYMISENEEILDNYK